MSVLARADSLIPSRGPSPRRKEEMGHAAYFMTKDTGTGLTFMMFKKVRESKGQSANSTLAGIWD